eukprot:g3434.t1
MSRNLVKRSFQHNPYTVLIYGDSNTWGYDPEFGTRIPYAERWTTLLENKLKKKLVYPFRLVVEGLNARTAVMDEVAGPCGGEYSCNGRKHLMEALHSAKPVDLVVIALGTNDQKSQYNQSIERIGEGIRCLIRDVKKSTGCCSPNGSDHPDILVMTPPTILLTEKSREWGFTNPASPEDVFRVFNRITVEEKCQMIDTNQCEGTEVSPLDGVHFPRAAQETISDMLLSYIPTQK